MELAEDEFPIQRLIAQKTAIQKAMRAVMKEGEHFGVIPGTQGKPSLLQPGADTLCFLFRLHPEYQVERVERDDLIAYDVRCVLKHIETGKTWGEGMGSANSREKKYAAQSTKKVCPQCQKPTIIKEKKEFDGGWLCWKKEGKSDGCGAKFADDDESIASQEGVAQTAGVWDLRNTILKMSCKRAKVAAILTATAASDCFTQDLEDLVEAGAVYTPPPAKVQTKGSEPASAAKPAEDANAGAPSAGTAGNNSSLPQERPWMKRLHAAMNKLAVGRAFADEKGMRGKVREEYLKGQRLLYLSWATEREINSSTDLTDDEASRVIAKAEAGEVP